MTPDKPQGAPSVRMIVFLLFLFSGVSGLIYEVLWTRMFSLVLGTTVYALVTVLGVYMGGLALGSWFFGRIVDRKGTNGFRLYAWLEGTVGLYAFLLPFLLDLSDEIYKMAWPYVSESFAGLMILRLSMSVAILIVPTTLMGGTLPALSRYLVRSFNRTGIDIGSLYAINTLGAVIGCFVTGFFLIELLGVQLTLTVAAVLNLSVALAAFFWSGRSRPKEPEVQTKIPERNPGKTDVAPAKYTPVKIKMVLWLFALSGMAALALEVLWTRSLMYFVNIDTWAFTAMLCAFLTGIGLGSLVMARFVERIRNPLLTLASIEILIGITAGLSIPLFELLYGTRNAGIWLVFADNLLLREILFKLSNSFLIMLVPTLLMGAAFPLVCRIYVGTRGEIGRGTGTLYALNTAGAILGSIGAGFVLLPLFGNIQSSILISASLYVVIGLVLLIAAMNNNQTRIRAAVYAFGGLMALAFVNERFVGQPVIKSSQFFKEEPGTFTLRHFYEGPDASIAVLEKANGLRELNINGQSTAFTNYMDMQVHRMLSHLPVLIHDDPKKVLVIGFGMGSTVWGCCQYDGVERVDVVELLRAEKETAFWFEAVNHGVLRHPKLKFIQGDGRNYLLGTREKYDVVSFNAIHPRYSANLYTVDFYRMCRKKMTPDGVLCAWMTQNALADVEWKMLCRSLTEVFPYSSLWYCNPQHFCLIASMKPMKIDFENWRDRMAEEKVAADLKDSNLEDPLVFLTRYMFSNEKLQDYLAESPLNTDDKPLVEFARSSIRDERYIINELINLKDDVSSILETPPESERDSDKLGSYDRASRWMMRGQMETWYPSNPFKAEIAFRKALLLSPDNQDVRRNLNFSEQIENGIRKVLQKNPNHHKALYDLGRIAMETGDFEKAEEYFSRSLAIRGGVPETWLQFGLLRLFQGRVEESAEILHRLIKSTPEAPPLAVYAYFEALIRLGIEVETAAEGQQNLIRRAADIAEYFDLMESTVLMMRGRHRQADR